MMLAIAASGAPLPDWLMVAIIYWWALPLAFGLLLVAFGIIWPRIRHDPSRGWLSFMSGTLLIGGVLGLLFLSGCASTVVDTQVIDRPVPVVVEVDLPRECRDRYAVDDLQPGADPAQINRAVLAEIEQRRACEVRLRGALEGAKNER